MMLVQTAPRSCAGSHERNSRADVSSKNRPGNAPFSPAASSLLFLLLQDAAPSSSGPSKTAEKKADKAAKKAASKKAASKNAKSPHPAGTPPAASVSVAPLVREVVRSTPAMYLDSDGPGPLKCVTAAKFFGVKVEAADFNPAGESNVGGGDKTAIFCRFISPLELHPCFGGKLKLVSYKFASSKRNV